ncbi:SWI/SNF-related matrix-associated actin-dependent regulator of chromatin subfamily A containing DEAD/H box 1 [Portunus trituberculatus]|uniref:SWI/SNF-related matrix-associated actin-dependent regulator of chromatin subfamily A containing DEAD/H box 1 n=1 Tax=Portunus trituberculatus TaxID=210409 RepID=A0A5B7FF23_PORTR|nr:SWI/SNF-related matrix-associated actin-dependent regulator of chromatin subfamily A containing DEAD/H box 1 [Portunus trituberculatus]
MSILIFVMPQLFDSKKEELKRVFAMFPRSDTSGNKGRFERERIEQAKRIMKPFFLRRLKCDVLKDLPLKEDEVIYSPLSARQKQIYQDTVAILSKKAQQQKVSVLETHLIQYTDLWNQRHYTDAKLKEIAKILKKTTHRDSVLEYIVEDFSVMSDFEIHNTCAQYNTRSSCPSPSLPPHQHIRQYRLDNDYILSSGKMEQLDVLLPKLKEEGSRVLIFSQFVIVLNILEQYTKLRGHKYLRFDGTTQVSERQELIDKYTEEEDIFLFLLSTKAGGLGINLTAANTVILHDIDFNPYNDKQAEDRCHRVGQTRPVKIIRLISKGTIEEGMLQIAQDKLQLEREVTGLEEGQQKRDVGMLLKVALGLVKPEAPSSSSSSENKPQEEAQDVGPEGDQTRDEDAPCEDSQGNGCNTDNSDGDEL